MFSAIDLYKTLAKNQLRYRSATEQDRMTLEDNSVEVVGDGRTHLDQDVILGVSKNKIHVRLRDEDGVESRVFRFSFDVD